MKNKLELITNKKIESFYYLDSNKSKEKIRSLINKYIIFEIHDKENKTIQIIPGKLLNYENDMLLIRQYDDGTTETKKIWTDYDGKDLFEDWEEKISINNIRGIEEYKRYNFNLKFEEEYKNCICEITNKNNKTIPVMIRGFDGFELEFDFKYQDDNEDVFIAPNTYPLYFIKEIRIINDTN